MCRSVTITLAGLFLLMTAFSQVQAETLPEQVARLEKELAALKQQVERVDAISGKPGPQGQPGRQGDRGPQGSPGLQGAPGPSGTLAIPGVSFSAAKMELTSQKGAALCRAGAVENGGYLDIYNKSGDSLAYLGPAPDETSLFVLGKDVGAAKALVLRAGEQVEIGPHISFNNNSGREIIRLGGAVGGFGILTLNDENGVRKTMFGADKEGGSALFGNAAGHLVASLGTSGNAGELSLAVEEEIEVVEITGESTLGGFARFFNATGKEIIYIGASKGGLGALQVNGKFVKDYAEVFELATRQGVEPGTVMAVVGPEARIAPAAAPYERRVVGVISGAGGLQPGAVVGSREDGSNDLPLAVSGQVYVRVCLESGSIEPGDLLVASSERGVAMRAANPNQTEGAVVGKALEAFGPNQENEGLVRMMVMLR